MPMPTFLALASLVHPLEGHVLVGGDNRQLPCIHGYDACADLRPSFARHLPFHTAYDYLEELHNRAGVCSSTQACISSGGMQDPFKA